MHQYFDWIEDQGWRHYNDMIAEGDVGYLRGQGVVRIDAGWWTY